MNEDPSKKELGRIVWLVHVYHVDRVRPMGTWSKTVQSLYTSELCVGLKQLSVACIASLFPAPNLTLIPNRWLYFHI